MMFKQSISYRPSLLWFCPDRDHRKGVIKIRLRVVSYFSFKTYGRGKRPQLDCKTVRIFAYSSTYAQAVKRGWKRRARLGRGAKKFSSRLTRPMLHKYMWFLICLVSPVLVKVYNVFPWSMYGQVRQPCLELQRNVPTGGLGVLSLFASFTRTSRSRKLVPERRKVTTGTSLKMFLKRSVDCWMGCFLRSMSWMLGRAGL